MLDRRPLNTLFHLSFRLRKNLKSFIIVHPSWFIRTILAVTRPFIRYHTRTHTHTDTPTGTHKHKHDTI